MPPVFKKNRLSRFLSAPVLWAILFALLHRMNRFFSNLQKEPEYVSLQNQSVAFWHE